VRVRIVIALLAGLFIATPLVDARTIFYYENECCRTITEGEFAVFYAQALKLREPAQGWTLQTAAAALSGLRHQPEKGWILSRFLSESVMAGLLQNSPFYRKPFNTEEFQKSNILVTIAKARGVFPVDDAITQGDFAILLVQALNLPRGRESAETATKTLASQPTPIGPTGGWQINAPLKESTMAQILASTAFRNTSIDPNIEVTPVQAYSLLFQKFEIATEGHFGVFLVKALGVPEPAGGWTKRAALDFVKTEFGVDSGYGWSPNAPLCVETFENALRKILLQLKKGGSAPGKPGNGSFALALPVSSQGSQTAFGEFGFAEPQAQSDAASKRNKQVEAFLNDLRHNGLIPADRCATMPKVALMTITGSQLRSGEPPPPPASNSIPPED
jgi:hypothetical protein